MIIKKKCHFVLGELSLEFPEARSQERGGILADGKKKRDKYKYQCN